MEQAPSREFSGGGRGGGNRNRQKPAGNNQNQGKSNHQREKGPGKLRGLQTDSPTVRLSKTLSWLLRHGAKSEGLVVRPDGYVKVTELLVHPKLTSLDFQTLQEIVRDNDKQRFHLLLEPTAVEDPENGTWWIRANQGHSIKAVQLELQPILSASEIPMAVHGTTSQAWQFISQQGLSKMRRNHIHLAQGVPADNVISGMRKSSQILIFIDVEKALAAQIKFFLSANGVVLTEGNDHGFLKPEFFLRVESGDRQVLPGWEETRGAPRTVTPA